MSVVNSKLFSTIPLAGVPASGLYTPPTNVTGFNTPDGVNIDPPYNLTLIGDASSNVVGSSTNPYLPAILPVYIPTLYANVYAMQTNLVNDLSGNFSDNRQYPTALAVKNYVASQISGFEDTSANLVPISTTLATSILEVPDTTSKTTIPTIDGDIEVSNYEYTMGVIDSSKNGGQKMVICNAPLSATATMDLYAGDTGVFAVLGKNYKHYQFAIQGDMIDMIQFINGAQNTFIVKSYGGSFF
jgi:hypothetical protein